MANTCTEASRTRLNLQRDLVMCEVEWTIQKSTALVGFDEQLCFKLVSLDQATPGICCSIANNNKPLGRVVVAQPDKTF